MPHIIDIAKRSFRTCWVNKSLWFFGFFAATAGNLSAGGSGNGHAYHAPGSGAHPSWLWPVLGVALLVGLVWLVLSILSEAALIEGVASGERGQRPSLRQGLRHSRRYFGRIIGLTLLYGLVIGLSVAMFAAPVLLTHFSVLALWLGVALTVLLTLVGIPWLLTVYFLYEYALRVAVLEDRSIADAIRHARRFLHGRIAFSVKLTLLSLAGRFGGGVALGAAMIPAGLIAGITYLVGGLAPAIAVGTVLAVPLVVLVLGATGAFRSSVWTLGFLDHRFQA